MIECSRKSHGMHASMTKHSRNFLIIILNAIPAEFRIARALVRSLGTGGTGILATLVKI